MLHAKQGKQRILSPSSAATGTPKCYLSIYVGERKKKRFLVPLAYLRHPSFQALLNLSQDEFGYAHPMGGLTFPCKEETFIKLTRDIVSDIIIYRDPTVRSMLTTVEMHLNSRAHATYVDSTSSSPMVLLVNSGTNARRSTSSTKKDFLTRRVPLRYDSTRDLYPVTKPSTIPHAFLASPYT
nr:auxin responsive SAUR protein [Tanacetum cinerariifolium]